MTGTGASSPFIKDEPEDNLFNSMHRFGNNNNGQNQQYGMAQQQYNHYGSTPGQNGSINPNELSMPMSVNAGSYMGGGFQNFSNNHQNPSNPSASFQKGISTLDDDDLLGDLDFQNTSHNLNNGFPQSNQNFNNIEEFDLGGSIYPTQTQAMSMGHHNEMSNVYSSTPDGDPIQSPFVHSYHQQLQQRMGFGGPMQTPNNFQGSPLASELHVGSGDNYMSARARPSMSMQRKSSHSGRSPLTPKTPGLGVSSLNINGNGHTQPIRTSSHRKTPSQNWGDSYGVSLQSFPGSSPVQQGMHPNLAISDILKTGSMPAKLAGQQGGSSSVPAMQTQEMKRRRRRESHNLVERRRRDNINERIQELSHLVPMHRLEDEKVRKALQNNSPLSPVLGGQGMSPPQATSGLAGPGARRAAPGGAGGITQGLPVEEKDKGPNKGDILNGSVSWTRDLMWMLNIKLEQLEMASQAIQELGGAFPIEMSEDERRMASELKDAIRRNGVDSFSYSRTQGTGLRVPKHTDYRGDPINGHSGNQRSGQDSNSLSPEMDNGLGEDLVVGQTTYWSGHNSGGDGSGPGSVAFKEEDEYGMDLTG